MHGILGKLTRWCIYLAAAGVMFLALLVGIARLLLPLVPDYQNDIRRWAGEATGFDVGFEYISASWPLAGPELRFFDVTISSREDRRPILEAESVTVGISILRLLFERQFAVSRIGVETARVDIQMQPAGPVLVQGRPVADLIPFQTMPADGFEIPDIRIQMNDIELFYAGAARIDDTLRFFIDGLDVRLSKSGIAVDGSVELADEFGESAEFSVDLPVELLQSLQQPDPEIRKPADRETLREGPAWSAYLAGEDLKVDRILESLLNMDVPMRNTRGDIIVRVNFAGLMPGDATLELDLSQVELDGVAGDTATYQGISGQLEWSRNDAGWRLAGTDLQFARNGQDWPEGDFSVAYSALADNESQQITGSASFVRLHDLYPIVQAIASEDVRADLLPYDIRGDVRNFDLDLTLERDGPARFDLRMEFDRVGFTVSFDGESVSGISGAVVADQHGGRLQIDSEASEFAWPKIFSGPIEMESADGFLVWRVTRDQIRVLSDNVRIRTPNGSINSRLELNLPRDGDSPTIDLTAFAEIPDASQSLRYLPMKIFSPTLQAWLERAVVAGRIPGAKFEFSGALREFPYDHGEGVFRVAVDIEDGILDYANRWPRVDHLETQVVFDGRRVFVTRNRGRIGGIPFGNAEIRIDDLRTAILKIAAREPVEFDRMLDFLRSSPISDAIGPTLDRVRGSGSLDTELRLTLPTRRLSEYKLNVDVGTQDAEIGLDGLDYGFSSLTGKIAIENTQVRSEGLSARLHDEPVTIELRPAMKEDGLYTHFAKVSGETPIGRWMEALNLPFAERLAGRINWNAMVLIPARDEQGQTPLHILVRSDLAGVESSMPAPFGKAADSSELLEIDIAFPDDGVLEVSGRLRSEISWAMRLESIEDRWQIERGAVHAGSALALLPVEPGIELSGNLEMLRFDDWLALTGDGEDSEWMELYRKADFSIEQLYLFGQAFSDVEVDASRDETDWYIDLNGPKIAGRVTVPMVISAAQPIDVRMERLWLEDEDPVDSGLTDPRNIQPAMIKVDDFVLRTMKFGSLQADLAQVSAGIIVDPIKIEADVFHIEGNAAWFVHPNDESIQQGQLRLDLEGTDIQTTLTNLGYDPVMEGKVVRVSGDVTWPGQLGDDFLERADGKLQINLEQGALLEVAPGGGGRLLGIMSVTALPRRLSLDFRDVFDEGLSFDTLKGDFVLNEGDAYTCNLSLEGSVANLGIVGRAGIGARDYDQVVVVKPHVSNVLAIPATVVGGPVIGAAVLLFSQIFKKPLSNLGETYYRISGSWDEPAIDRIKGEELDLSPIKDCEQYLAAQIPRLSPE